MGNKVTSFTDSQLEAYQDCTFFTKKDILRVFYRFKELDTDRIPYNINPVECSNIKLPMRTIASIPELKENPFRRRICEVFSDDGSGNMCFDDFLNMFSVFSEAATRDIKTTYAFQIYDYNCDNFLDARDLKRTLQALTNKPLDPSEVSFVIKQVLEESDLDGDGMLSYSEFEHVISRAPEFISTFHIRI